MKRVLLAILMAIWFTALALGRCYAQTSIVLDGEFQDWVGKAHLDDPLDAQHDTYDLASLYWANNPNEEGLYFMIERHRPKNPQVERQDVYYCLFVDTNNNGVFGDSVDRVIDVWYVPYHPGIQGLVTVDVYEMEDGRAGRKLANHSGLWGEHTQRGGRRCEWYATFDELGLEPGQVIRMVLFGTDKNRFSSGSFGHRFPASFEEWEDMVARRWADRLPDYGDIQWAPVPALSIWLLGILVTFAVVLVARYYRQMGRVKGIL